MAVTVTEGVKATPDKVSRVLACNCKAIDMQAGKLLMQAT